MCLAFSNPGVDRGDGIFAAARGERLGRELPLQREEILAQRATRDRLPVTFDR